MPLHVWAESTGATFARGTMSEVALLWTEAIGSKFHFKLLHDFTLTQPRSLRAFAEIHLIGKDAHVALFDYYSGRDCAVRPCQLGGGLTAADDPRDASPN